MKLGFIGLGIMGSAMASNLVKAGYDLTIWNRSKDVCIPLVDRGATVAASPREVAERCDIVLTMMANPAAVQAVRDGDDGITAGLSSGKSFIDMSTVDAATSLESARIAHEKGAAYLEAPVAGSRKPAEDGALTIMAAGDKRLYETALPVLEKLGKKILYLGDTGNAARMKLANNLVMGNMLAALGEGMALAAKSGLDTTQLLELLDSGAMSNPMFRLKGPLIAASGAIPAAFPLKHMQKDLRLALRLAEEVGQPLFLTATANEVFKTAMAQGLGDDDFAAVSRVMLVR